MAARGSDIYTRSREGKNMQERNRYIIGYLLLAVLLYLLVVINIMTGSVALTPERVIELLKAPDDGGTMAQILWQIRLPRLIAAAILGVSLSVSGFLLQNFFGNPIAGPFVLGISSGAKLVVALTMILALGRG
jgi:iron complex transport system permease protein